jgi:hypothetical protein
VFCCTYGAYAIVNTFSYDLLSLFQPTVAFHIMMWESSVKKDPVVGHLHLKTFNFANGWGKMNHCRDIDSSTLLMSPFEIEC